MPLYTYVVSYRGFSHVSQASRSNFQGFADWYKELPPDTPPGLKQKIADDRQIYAGFEPVPNRKHVWRKVVPVGSEELVIVAVQTMP